MNLKMMAKSLQIRPIGQHNNEKGFQVRINHFCLVPVNRVLYSGHHMMGGIVLKVSSQSHHCFSKSIILHPSKYHTKIFLLSQAKKLRHLIKKKKLHTSP